MVSGGVATGVGGQALPSAGSSGAAVEKGSGGSNAGGSVASSGAPAMGGAKSVGGASGSGGTSSSGASGAPASTGGVAGSASGGSGAAVTGGAGGTGGRGTGGSGGAPLAKGCNWTADEGKTVLFDGKNLDQWQTPAGKAAPWRLVSAENAFEVVPNAGNIQSKAKFESVCLHVEYLTPMYAASVTGQQRGNSGIYLKSAYELQVLDSASAPAANNTCGAVYGVRAPLVVACHGQLLWNTYEIEFRGSEWTGSTKTNNAMVVSARLNGMLVQQNVDLDVSSTEAGQPDAAGAQPIMLQDHGNEVRFRNIWATIPSY